MKTSVLDLESRLCRFANLQFTEGQLSVWVEVDPYGSDPSDGVSAATIVFHDVASFAFLNDSGMSQRTVDDSRVLDELAHSDDTTPMTGVSIAKEFTGCKWFRYEVTAGCEAVEVLCRRPAAVLPG